MPDIQIDKLIRSRRRTIGLQITNDMRLIVRAPFFASEDFIRKLIVRKEAWINSKKEHFKQRLHEFKAKKFIPYEKFLYLGKTYPLTVINGLSKDVVLEDNSLLISQAVIIKGSARKCLESWYKTKALEYISQKTAYFAQIEGFHYRSIKLSNAAARWGSCGPKDTLNFSWRLIMAPVNVVDYVIVHELVHLKKKGHARHFWQEVARIMPNYKQEERWLKKNGHLLNWA